MKLGLGPKNFKMAPPHTNGSMSFAATSNEKITHSLRNTASNNGSIKYNVHTFGNLVSGPVSEVGVDPECIKIREESKKHGPVGKNTFYTFEIS